ncbi:glutathione S-transferase N-terminal domain-containing protein [Bradyrhizobium genosp. P]|uniref:glutathione S-transferase N-terminal domain-containing protein n=1 Tax=Bradyrhizobium genosp. P TaxID=83641 RepID=UPI003CE82DB5
MIDLHYWTTPNGHKITMFLEETGLPYRIVPVNLVRDEQFKPEFLKIAPNNKIPAIVDNDPIGGGEPISLFESGAILLYLVEKTGKLIPKDIRGRMDATQWLFWQVAGLGPMAGQLIFFKRSTEKHPFGIERYGKETHRLFSVLNKRLADREYLAGGYSVADIAAYTWAAPYNLFELDLEEFPHLERWLEAVASRPATERAYAIAKEMNPQAPQPVRRAQRLGAKASLKAS